MRELPTRPSKVKRDRQGWTEVNPGPLSGGPYLNYCRDCGWAGSVALWFGDGRGPHCPRCRSREVGVLTPQEGR